MKTVARTPPAPGALRCERRADDTLLVHLVGPWTICDFNYKMAQTAMLWLNASTARMVKICKRVASSISMS